MILSLQFQMELHPLSSKLKQLLSNWKPLFPVGWPLGLGVGTISAAGAHQCARRRNTQVTVMYRCIYSFNYTQTVCPTEEEGHKKIK